MLSSLLIKPRKYVFLVIAIGMIAASSLFNAPVREYRKELMYEPDPIHGTSPTLVLATAALGAFRGIILDVVWIRMEELKQDGKCFEIVQLADLACKLSPRFPKVWKFNAWNMAYNVSVEIPDLYERWRWVRAGVDLLKDRGIPYNPDSPLLYQEIAWIYYHKMGGILDDAHLYYKQELGLYMHEVLGGSGERENLVVLKAAPQTREELLQDQGVAGLLESFSAQKFDPLNTKQLVEYLRDPDAEKFEVVRSLLVHKAAQKAFDKIVSFARAKRLREECRLDVDRMISMMDQYGPFDWRSPYSHAMYWALLGREKTISFNKQKLRQLGKEKWDSDSDKPYREIDFDRIIYGAFQDLVKQGRLVFNTKGKLIPLLGPDYRFADALETVFEEMLRKYSTKGNLGLKNAHENFLRRMVVEMYYSGQKSKSVKFWKILISKYKKTKYALTYDAYVVEAFQTDYVEQIGSTRVTQIVYGWLLQAFIYYGANMDDEAAHYEMKAKALADVINKQFQGSNRIEIPFEKIKTDVLMMLFSGQAQVPADVLVSLKERLGPVADKLIARLEALKKQKPAIDYVNPKGKRR